MKHNGGSARRGLGWEWELAAWNSTAKRDRKTEGGGRLSLWLYKLNCASILYLFWSFMIHLKPRQAGRQEGRRAGGKPADGRYQVKTD